MQNTHRGFTLLELFTGLAIASLLFAVAGPQFSNFNDNGKIRSSASEFQSFILLARTEAVTRNSTVNLTSTLRDNWGGEITMCVADDQTRPCTHPNSTIIQTTNIGRGEVAIMSSANADPIISFNTRGRLSGAVAATMIELAFCDQRGIAAEDKAKILTINVTGRPSIEGLDILQGHTCDPN